MVSSDELGERISVFARELAAVLGEVDERSGDCWLDAVENQAVELGDRIGLELARQMSHRRSAEAESLCPQCGQPGRHAGMRERELIGRRGPVRVAEPKYFCPCCRKAFFPDDPRDRGGDRLSLHGGNAQEGGACGRAVGVLRRRV